MENWCQTLFERLAEVTVTQLHKADVLAVYICRS